MTTQPKSVEEIVNDFKQMLEDIQKGSPIFQEHYDWLTKTIIAERVRVEEAVREERERIANLLKYTQQFKTNTVEEIIRALTPKQEKDNK